MCVDDQNDQYGVATISRLLKNIGLFCRICLFYGALLQKKTIILRSLLMVATPYHYSWCSKWWIPLLMISSDACVTRIFGRETCERDTWMRHVTRKNELCHIYEWVLYAYEWVTSHVAHTWTSHVIYMNDSCHKHEWVTSHKCMSQVTRMNESWRTGEPCERVTSHICISHGMHMNEPCHTCEWFMA